MDRKQLLEQLDAVYNAGGYEKIEAFMTETIAAAKEEGDWVTQIMIGNELMGFYRDRGLTSKGVAVYNEIRKLFEEHGLTEDISFASTVLNAANLYRADGQLTAALEMFDEVREIYEEVLPPTDFRLAGLYNNMGLAYMDKGERFRAREYLEKALRIVKALPNTTVEQATNHVNLANIYARMDRPDRVEENLAAAERLYASIGNNDPHYSGFLATRAEIALKNEDPVSAERDYREALKELEKYYGKSRAYAKTCHNLAAALDAQEKAEEAAGYRRQAEEIMAALKSTW